MLVSVIIPVYNTEPDFLKQCFDSVLLHKDVELVVVNDGSKREDTVKVCEHYNALYPNMLYISKENEGQSVARNIAIDAAKGDYIIFLDSDDWWSGDFIEKSREIIDESFPDILICDAQKVEYTTGETKLIGRQCTQICYYESGHEVLKKLLIEDSKYEWYPWRYLFKKSLFENKSLRFKKGIIYEDVELIPRLILSAKTVARIPSIFVNYRFHNPTSSLNEFNLKKSNDKIVVVDLSVDNAESINDNELRTMLLRNISDLYLSAFSDYIYGVEVDEALLRKNLFVVKQNHGRYGKFVCIITSLLGFKLGSKCAGAVVKILKIIRGYS